MFKQLMKIKCRVTFKFLGKYVGVVQRSNNHIWIDLTGKENIASTFLHELIHILKPKWKEERVLLAEKKLFAKLSHKQVWRVYKKLYRDALRVK